jgi:hypothetical protein
VSSMPSVVPATAAAKLFCAAAFDVHQHVAALAWCDSNSCCSKLCAIVCTWQQPAGLIACSTSIAVCVPLSRMVLFLSPQ